MHRSIRRTLTSIVAGAIVLAAVPSAATPAAVLTDGDCSQIAAFVPVPVDNVRHLVGPSFVIAGEEAGRALVLVTAGECAPWTVAGRTGPGMRFGLVSVVAHPRGGEAGTDAYDLWWLFDHAPTHAAWSSLGIFSRVVNGIQYETERSVTGGVTAADAFVPWGPSPFTIESTVLDALPRPAEFPSRHWYEGAKGIVFGDHTNTEGGILPSAVTISTPEGSPLAEILGASTVRIAGGYLEFHHSATTGIVSQQRSVSLETS